MVATDRSLAALGHELDVLLEVTPINTDSEWEAWRVSRAEPSFRYREPTFDPQSLQTRAAQIDVDSVEDPHLREMFAAAARNLELQAQLVLDRNTDQFLPTSLELHDGCNDDLLHLALGLLGRMTPSPGTSSWRLPSSTLTLPRRSCEHYRSQLDDFEGTVALLSRNP